MRGATVICARCGCSVSSMEDLLAHQMEAHSDVEASTETGGDDAESVEREISESLAHDVEISEGETEGDAAPDDDISYDDDDHF